MTEGSRIHCDGFGCNETHPIQHEALGDPGYGPGRWLGWVYLDLNRPDLYSRPLRFCSTQCLSDWIAREACRDREPLSKLDERLRREFQKSSLKGLGVQDAAH